MRQHQARGILELVRYLNKVRKLALAHFLTKMEGINVELPGPLPSETSEIAWGIPKSGGNHSPMWISRPKVNDKDVKFEMLYCGICHSDVHTGKNDWGPCTFPFVSGHELLGRVTEVGREVKKLGQSLN